MQDAYTIKQDLTYMDYVRLTLYMLTKNKMIRRLIIFIFCICILATLSGLLAPGPNEVFNGSSLLMTMLLPPLGIVLFFVVFVFIGGFLMMKFKSDLLKGVTFTFTHLGMERQSAKSESSISWRDFQDVKETKNFILLFVREKNLNNSYAIKKSDLSSPEFEDELKQFIDKYAPL